MHYIASKLPDTESEFSELTSDVQAMVRELSTTLGQEPDVVLRKLQRIKKAQDNNGLMHYIASKLPDTESEFSELTSDVQAMVRELSTTLGQDPEDVLRKLQRIKAGQRMHYIASQLPPGTINSISDLPDKGMRLLIKEVSITLGQDPEDVLRKLQRIKTAQVNNGERISSLNHSLHYLAKEFNGAPGGVEERQIAITSLPEFTSFMNASGRDPISVTDREAAIEEVMRTARAYDITFWKHLVELKAYHDKFPGDVVKIDDKKILTIKSGRSKQHDTLKRWMEEMIGYEKHKRNAEYYGLKAYEKMGSIEQLAMVDEYVCFDLELYETASKEAQKQRLDDNSRGLMSLFGDAFGMR